MSFSRDELQGKKAILYVRISTEDQSNYSLIVQEEQLRLFCERHEIQIVAFFREDGASAKSFKRPEFQRCLEVLKTVKNFADYFLVVKWDRFSRNAEQALNMISVFKKHGVVVNSSDQWINFSDPTHTLMLAIYLATPQVENDVRSEKVTLGMRRARKEGRVMSNPPTGYIRIPDGIKHSKIVIGPTAHFVIEAFERVAEGVYSVEELRKDLYKRGFKCSRAGFFKILRNPVYISKQVIDAYKDEPEEIVDCLHEPLISEELFYKAQKYLSGFRKTRQRKHHNSEELILRGFLGCQKCSKFLSASFSRSRNKSLHSYYHCNPCKERFRTDLVNSLFLEFLGSFVFPSEVLDLYEKILRNHFQEQSKNKKENLGLVEKDLEKLDTKLLSLERKFVEGEIEADSFSRVKSSYQEEMATLRQKKISLAAVNEHVEKYISFSVYLLSRLDKFYQEISLDGKRVLVGSICGEKLYFSENSFRTASLNQVVVFLASIHQGLETSENKKDGRKTPSVYDGGLDNTLFEHLVKIYSVKRFIA